MARFSKSKKKRGDYEIHSGIRRPNQKQFKINHQSTLISNGSHNTFIIKFTENLLGYISKFLFFNSCKKNEASFS